VAYKFEQLEVWQRALEYTDRTYQIADQLPKHERYNLADQLTRAANSIALNIAEGSTGVSDTEQGRFLGIAVRSLLETVACLHLIKRRDYVENVDDLREAYQESEVLFAQLQAFRASLRGDSSVREGLVDYNDGAPF
jgi:four helix bundle protein